MTKKQKQVKINKTKIKRTAKSIPWTRFMDMNSGGGLKEKQQYIYIQAPIHEANLIFYNRFNHNPERVTCTCCGEDYSISEAPTLEESTAYERSCKWNGKKYIEEPDDASWKVGRYLTIEQYCKREDVLVIRSDEIKDSERTGELPSQGYVWIG